jgi:hypothetical protein
MQGLVLNQTHTVPLDVMDSKQNIFYLSMQKLDSRFKFAIDDNGRQFVQVADKKSGELLRFGFVLAHVEYDGTFKELRFRCVNPGRKHLELSLHS